jgi:hypothetical protein
MTIFPISLRRASRRGVAMGAVLALLTTGSPVAAPAEAAGLALPIGTTGLVEMRTSQNLAPGVTLTRIVRGLQPTTANQIGITAGGPWRINVLRIDPAHARGQLKATYGPDLARTEKVTDLVRKSRAVVGTNASYFTYTANLRYPGEPRGLGLYGGALLSEPAAVSNEVDLLVDAKTLKISIGRLTWRGRMKNRSTDKTLTLEYINHPPVVPSGCRKTADQTKCTKSGDVVNFTPQFGRSTPTGYGVEAILDREGCRVRVQRTRGVVLRAGQTSIQATGRQTIRLLKIIRRGCLSRDVRLYNETGSRLKLTSSLYGVAGRYRLTRAGRIVVPSGSAGLFARSPRTIAGRTANGTLVLATIDGRQTTSIGATLAETAKVAHALGMVDAVNLDGGGSTTMSVRGELVNQPSDIKGERAVGDALVYIDSPAR